MHILQKTILDELRSAPSLRYSEMHPKHIESSHFKYHLDQLIKSRLVSRIARGEYALTLAGKSTVDRLSADRPTLRVVPKLITYTLLQNSDTYFLYRKEKEPYLGLLNMVGGKIHMGETTSEASQREVREKTGIEAINSKQRVIAEVRTYMADALLTHAIAYVYVANVEDVPVGDTLIAVPKHQLIHRTDLAPDLLAIIDELNGSGEVVSTQLDIRM